MRPGWGTRHPELEAALAVSAPIATHDTAWLDGALPLRVSAHVPLVDLPDELVLSVRCLVLVDGLLVVCTNRDGQSHPWPGGRREPGESFVETACREVHEETGWRLDPESLQGLGWLHLHHLTRQPDDHPYPHPDFLQVVFTGRATERDGGRDNNWSDTEGYEMSSWLVPVSRAVRLISDDPVSRAFLTLLPV